MFEVFSGEIVGVYDESVFMWTPTEYTTISVFTCWDASVPFSQFSTRPGDPAAIFSLSNREIASIKIVAAPQGAVEYREYSRQRQTTQVCAGGSIGPPPANRGYSLQAASA